MDRPILEPGRPGDLRGIMRNATEHLNALEASGRDPTLESYVIAGATLTALCAWLGVVEVPTWPEPN